MKIFLVDQQKYVYVTFQEAMNILASGLKPEEWTRSTIKPYLLY